MGFFFWPFGPELTLRLARAAERYSWDACADAYLRLCDAVTGRGRRGTQPV